MSHADPRLRGPSALGVAVGGLWLLLGFLLSEPALDPCCQRCAIARAAWRAGQGGAGTTHPPEEMLSCGLHLVAIGAYWCIHSRSTFCHNSVTLFKSSKSL
jgi:hypothetical protein